MTKRVEGYGNPFTTTGTRVNSSGLTIVKATAGILEQVIVNDNGADCTMTIANGGSTLGIAPLTGDTPRVIDCGFNCDDSIKITLSGTDPASHWYKLDSTSGTTATDSGTGTADDLTLINMKDSDWQSGKIGQCLYFDGVDENMTSSSPIFTSSSSAFSICFWVNWSVWGNTYMLSQDGGNEVLIYFVGSGDCLFRLKKGGQYITVFYPAYTFTPTQWYHVAWTYDGSNKAAGVSLYINGGKRDLTISLDTLTPATWTGTMMFACNLFNGKLDDIRFYDSELSENDVDWIVNYPEGRLDDYSMADVLVVHE